MNTRTIHICGEFDISRFGLARCKSSYINNNIEAVECTLNSLDFPHEIPLCKLKMAMF